MQPHVSVSYRMPMLAELLRGPGLNQSEDIRVGGEVQLTGFCLCKYNTAHLKRAALFLSSLEGLFT